MSPTRLSGVSTSSQNLAGLAQHRLDHVGRGVGEAGQIVVAVDVEDVVEQEQHVVDGRFVGRHCPFPAGFWVAPAYEPLTTR